jgi:spermidine synthase
VRRFTQENLINSDRRTLLFALFFLSGFCGLLYQVVWVRLAFAAFGIVTPVISVVISVFMLGLAAGSWAGGRSIEILSTKTARSAIFFYALVELAIGIGAFVVPGLFGLGETLLRQLGEADSIAYLSLSALAITLSIFPWCFAMGATFPVMMAYVREQGGEEDSFSHLYLGNVVGASLGAMMTAGVLVETFGFRHTLWLAGALNFVIAAAGLLLGLAARGPQAAPALGGARANAPAVRWSGGILFTTGLASLAMEVIWTRAFTPVLGTQVYAFAGLLVVYLIATWIGSWAYRRDLRRGLVRSVGALLALAALTSLLPVILNDPRLGGMIGMHAALALASVVPLCFVLGYLTPRLIDNSSRGDPRIAGRAYALNVIGCILGPLLASYVLLPFLGATVSLVVLALPLMAFAWIFRVELPLRWRRAAVSASAAAVACALVINVSYENPCPWVGRTCEIRRDYAATVVAWGEGSDKALLVNGVGITNLTPVTKYMAHLPLAFHPGKPDSALVICFGMGTTYRSLLSWDLRTVAVELVPSVRDVFPYFHADAGAVLARPDGRIVIDDGRRFLNRTRETYDVIVVDPPPPIEAAGSSLLYSTEFHEAVKMHLKPGGIFQTWFPSGEETIARALAKSLVEVFPHVRVYRSVEGWGLHFLASMEPLNAIDATAMLRRIPPAAQSDLAEWSRAGLQADVQKVLSQEVPIGAMLPPHPTIRISDDRPYNEYFLLRRLQRRLDKAGDLP